MINQTGAALGLKAGGSSMTLADMHNPGRIAQIGVEMFGRTAALAEGMNLITDFFSLVTILIAAFFVMLGFFLLALQLFVVLIAFKLGSLAAFIALPWGVFNGTAWIAERPLGWVAGSAMRLFVLALVASASMTFVETLPPTFTLDFGGALNILLFGLTMLALAWFAPMLGSEVVQGQPHLSGSDAVRAGVGATFTTIAGGYLAYKAGKGVVKLGGAAVRGVGGALGGIKFGGKGGGRGGGGDGYLGVFSHHPHLLPSPGRPPQVGHRGGGGPQIGGPGAGPPLLPGPGGGLPPLGGPGAPPLPVAPHNPPRLSGPTAMALEIPYREMVPRPRPPQPPLEPLGV